MNREEIEQAITALEQRKLALLTGKGRLKVSGADGGSVDFQQVSISEIDQEITRLKVALGKLTGTRSGVGPVIAVIGGRT
ncbi:hypothetical protein [Roseibium suaedae]|uniref:Uncharacterized protein n=1 Tax=Roseibium suaedae TaxID=735517 RepID=A0A1M7PM66_9HYPH|nr:hypothetical protein [Roseibium suaedae]SHN18317.1 hypothetical protein SAMN05444272_4504 [Roseibium suaedae]